MTTNIFNIQSQRDVQQQGNRNKVERKRKTVRSETGWRNEYICKQNKSSPPKTRKNSSISFWKSADRKITKFMFLLKVIRIISSWTVFCLNDFLITTIPLTLLLENSSQCLMFLRGRSHCYFHLYQSRWHWVCPVVHPNWTDWCPEV